MPLKTNRHKSIRGSIVRPIDNKLGKKSTMTQLCTPLTLPQTSVSSFHNSPIKSAQCQKLPHYHMSYTVHKINCYI